MKTMGFAYPEIMALAPSVKVLAVDDDPLMLRVLSRMLRGRGVELVTSLRSMGVLNLISMHRPALVLMDVKMPGLEGTSLVRLIRGDVELAATPIVLHSALGDDVLALKTKECGADGYILKSRGMTYLEQSIDRWLRRTTPARTAALSRSAH